MDYKQKAEELAVSSRRPGCVRLSEDIEHALLEAHRNGRVAGLLEAADSDKEFASVYLGRDKEVWLSSEHYHRQAADKVKL